MRVAVFFVYLCLLLFKGEIPVYGDTPSHNNNGYTFTHFIAQKHQVNYSGISQEYALLEDDLSCAEKEYLVGDDVEDEDTDHSLAKKYRVLVQSYIALYYRSLAGYRCQRLDIFPDCFASSPRYITQRVLRI